MGRAKGTVPHEAIVEGIRQLIAEGELASGERVSEAALCERFGVSRTPLREALKVLASEGLITLIANRGARVGTLTPKKARDLFEVVASLEALAGDLACQRIDADTLTALERLQEAMETAHGRSDLESYYCCNRRIHETIVAASANDVLIDTYKILGARLRLLRFSMPMSDEHWSLALREHAVMLDALHRRDSEVMASILRTHLRHKRESVLSAIDDSQYPELVRP